MEQKKEILDRRKKVKPNYEKPVLMEYNTNRAAGHCLSGSAATINCVTGSAATAWCADGASAGFGCGFGTIIS